MENYFISVVRTYFSMFKILKIFIPVHKAVCTKSFIAALIVIAKKKKGLE